MAALIVAAAALVWLASSKWPDNGGHASTEDAYFIVERKPIKLYLHVVGTIEPASILTIPAPFDGAIEDILFEYGQAVEQGQTLLAMDTSDLDIRIRDARATYLKARQEKEALDHWETGSEASRARRSYEAARLAADDLRRKLEETGELLKQGIVPRIEYDNLQQQLRAQELTVANAKQELEATLRRASRENKTIAELQLTNAQEKLHALETLHNKSIVIAPIKGMTVQAPEAVEGNASRSKDVTVGSKVTSGQSLLGIAETTGLAISAMVDETDVNQITVGQVATVTGDGFPGQTLTGHVTAVSAPVTAGAQRAQSTGFIAKIRVNDLTPEQQRVVRLGMSANVAIVLYENDNALILPNRAIRTSKGGLFVKIRSVAGLPVREVPIQLLRSTPDGVEISASLKAGDHVLLRGN